MLALTLVPATEADGLALSRWAPTPADVLLFAGPRVSHPLGPRSLLDTATDGWTVLALRAGGGTPVATGSYQCREEGAAHLGRLLVDPARRGQGIGRALVEHLVVHVSALPGVEAVTLNVFADNEPARRLYGAMGFVPVQEWSDDDGRPAFRMRRDC